MHLKQFSLGLLIIFISVFHLEVNAYANDSEESIQSQEQNIEPEEGMMDDHFFPRPYPRPHYQYWRCIGWDNRWEEHRGGHAVFGYQYQQTYYTAMNRCQSYHRFCRVTCDRIW